MRELQKDDIKPTMSASSNSVLAATLIERARRKKWTFEEAIEHKVFSIIGQGNIDFPSFFRTLLGNGFSGWSVIEQDVKFGATEIPPKVSVAASLAYLNGELDRLAQAAGA